MVGIAYLLRLCAAQHVDHIAHPKALFRFRHAEQQLYCVAGAVLLHGWVCASIAVPTVSIH